MPDLQVPCAICDTLIVATVANPHIVNMFAATMIVIEHPIPVSCPRCKKTMVVTVMALGAVMLSARSPHELQASFDFSSDIPPTVQ